MTRYQGAYWRGWSKVAPHASGVYFLVRDGIIVYIGRSKDILTRLRCHQFSAQIRSGEFSVDVHLAAPEESAKLEREWIQMLDPELNDEFVSKESRERLRKSNGSHQKPYRRSLLRNRKWYAAKKGGSSDR